MSAATTPTTEAARANQPLDARDDLIIWMLSQIMPDWQLLRGGLNLTEDPLIIAIANAMERSPGSICAWLAHRSSHLRRLDSMGTTKRRQAYWESLDRALEGRR